MTRGCKLQRRFCIVSSQLDLLDVDPLFYTYTGGEFVAQPVTHHLLSAATGCQVAYLALVLSNRQLTTVLFPTERTESLPVGLGTVSRKHRWPGGRRKGAKRTDVRVVSLERAPGHGVVGLWNGSFKLPSATCSLDGRISGRSVDEVTDPGVPAGLELRRIVVVLRVADPAGAKGQLLLVFVVLVASAIGADVSAVLGIAWGKKMVRGLGKPDKSASLLSRGGRRRRRRERGEQEDRALRGLGAVLLTNVLFKESQRERDKSQSRHGRVERGADLR